MQHIDHSVLRYVTREGKEMALLKEKERKSTSQNTFFLGDRSFFE
jgi:hypothetical protein